MVMSMDDIGTPRHICEAITNKDVFSPNLLGDVTEHCAVRGHLVPKSVHGYRQIANKKLRAGALGKRIVGKKNPQADRLPNGGKHRNYFSICLNRAALIHGETCNQHPGRRV